MNEQIVGLIEKRYNVDLKCDCEDCKKNVVNTENLMQWDYLLDAIYKLGLKNGREDK